MKIFFLLMTLISVSSFAQIRLYPGQSHVINYNDVGNRVYCQNSYNPTPSRKTCYIQYRNSSFYIMDSYDGVYSTFYNLESALLTLEKYISIGQCQKNYTEECRVRPNNYSDYELYLGKYLVGTFAIASMAYDTKIRLSNMGACRY